MIERTFEITRENEHLEGAVTSIGITFRLDNLDWITTAVRIPLLGFQDPDNSALQLVPGSYLTVLVRLDGSVIDL